MRTAGPLWRARRNMGTGMKILAVDDDPVFLELLGEMLRQIGPHDVTPLLSAEQGLRELDSGAQVYDCILSDMQMPGMDGVAFTAAIRARKAWRQTPILVITSMAGKAFVDAAFAAGATDYVTKPLDAMELKARIGMVARLLAERRRMAEFARLVAHRGAAAEVKAEFGTPIQIPGFDGCVDFVALENYLNTLGVKRAYGTAAFAVHIRNAGVIFAKASGMTFVQMLGDVAALITDALKGQDALLAYAGGGTFVVMTERDADLATEDAELFINIGLMEFEAIYTADRLPVPQVRLGDLVRASFLSPGKPTRIVDRAIASALREEKRKSGALVA